MPNKDLSNYQIGDLVLTLRVEGGFKKFAVPPPSSARGVMLTRMVTLGFEVAFNPESISEEGVTKHLGKDFLSELQEGEDGALEKLCLTEAVYKEMFDAAVPIRDIQMAARYASFYFVFDAATADKIMEDQAMKEAGVEALTPEKTELPKQ